MAQRMKKMLSSKDALRLDLVGAKNIEGKEETESFLNLLCVLFLRFSTSFLKHKVGLDSASWRAWDMKKVDNKQIESKKVTKLVADLKNCGLC